LSQRIAKNSAEAAVGKGQAFTLLREARNDFETCWCYLQSGNPATQLPPAPQSVATEMDAVAQVRQSLRADASIIVDSEQTVVSLHEVATVLAASIPQLQGAFEEVVEILLENEAPAAHLAEAAEHQAQEIAGASAAINEMAVSIDQVSANAAESAAVAERSVAIANKGSEVMHNTIIGMNNIRKQIQALPRLANESLQPLELDAVSVEGEVAKIPDLIAMEKNWRTWSSFNDSLIFCSGHTGGICC